MNKLRFCRNAVFTCTLYIAYLLAGLVPGINIVSAQNGPLSGSGNVVEKKYPFSGFDKITLENLNGMVEIESGRPFSVQTAIDDNLQSLLDVTVNNNTLKIQLKNNEGNRLYIENTHIRIKITLPEISVLQHTGNSRLSVKGISGRYFRISNQGNGYTNIEGSIDELEIAKTGNGDVHTRNLLAKKVNVMAAGNGDISINTAGKFSVQMAGNGDLTNYGTGRANADVAIGGNGKIFYKQAEATDNITMSDLKPLAGKWTGTLTYLDYTSAKQVSIPCNLEADVHEAQRKLKLFFIYPDEPKYNSSEKFNINQEGTKIGDAAITEINRLNGGGLQVTTEERGEDDRKPCTIKQILTITGNLFSITKMVKIDGETSFFQRNEYRWGR